MHRVLRHIDGNLAASLELAELASVANFSAFHFHRLFAAWTGERVGDYVRRRRLEVAAIRLVTQPASTVLEVALSVGFGSSEAFSRSFKLHFAESPSTWRTLQRNKRLKDAKMDQHDSNPDQAFLEQVLQHGKHHNPLKEPAMEVQLKSLESTEIAYMRYVGPYGPPIADFWIKKVAPWMKANGLLNVARYGISHDDPSITDAGKCRYDACVDAPSNMVLGGDAQRATLPGGRYATMQFKGSPEEIGKAWTYLLRDWLPSSGLQMDNRPCFEYYPAESADGQSAQEFACVICIPVAKL
jgi:AraC family transcriptional regulator